MSETATEYTLTEAERRVFQELDTAMASLAQQKQGAALMLARQRGLEGAVELLPDYSIIRTQQQEG